MEKICKVSYSGKIFVGNKELSCAVLDDGTRILTNTAIFQGLSEETGYKHLTQQISTPAPFMNWKKC